MRTWEMCNNREAFESRLKSMNGVEYLIVGEPQKIDDPALADTGIWVIRKQDRKKRVQKDDEVTVLGTYYIIGDNMYQAPSVYDIVGNRLVSYSHSASDHIPLLIWIQLSAMNSLNKFAELAKPLPLFTPAVGYTYYPPTTNKATNTSQASANQSSRESSVAPNLSQSNTAAVLESGPQPSSNTSAAQAPDPRDSFALFESFQIMERYGDEYMDENPLRGEPGNFTFTATKERIRAKQAEAEAAKAREAEIARKLEESRIAAAATPFARTTTTEKTKTGGAVVGSADGVKATVKKRNGEKRKRKSRNATSPTSPMTPATPATPAS